MAGLREPQEGKWANGQDMPRYVQFQRIDNILNLDLLKFWLNTHQIKIEQLSAEQRIKLKIHEPFIQRPVDKRPEDMTFGDVYGT